MSDVETTNEISEVVKHAVLPNRTPIVAPEIALMLDIETLDLGPTPIITQVALYGLDLGEDTILESHHYHFYPIKPQMDLLPARTFSVDTLVWWMEQGEEARSRIKMSTDDDFETMPALLNGLVATFNHLTNRGTRPYELWARGPQFDVVAVETLMKQCDVKIPWKYDTVRDLRTLMALAGLNARDVIEPAGFIKHAANWDVKFQFECLREARRLLRAIS